MRVSIHQPQYLPWFPYIKKIIDSDLFIFLDTVDFQKNGLQNRNKILTSNGPTWLTVPVKQKLGQKIKDTSIVDSLSWRSKHFNTLCMWYGELNFVKSIQDVVHHLYMNTDNSLANLNISFTRFILSTMNVSTPVLRSSQLNVNGSSTHLLISLCREVGATSYLSGLGANNYLDTSLFVAAGIDLEFSPPVTPKPYPHCFTKFGSHTDLSVVDFLFNCGLSWRDYL